MNMWKLAVLVAVFFVAVPVASGLGLRYAVVENVYPDTTTRQNDLNIVTSVGINTSLTDIDIDTAANVTAPNGTVLELGLEHYPNLSDLETLKRSDTVPSEFFEETGEYVIDFRANSSAGGNLSASAVYTYNGSSIDTMAVQLSVMLALLFVAALFAYLGFNLNPVNKFMAAFRVMFLLASPLFAAVGVLTGGMFASQQGNAVSTYMWPAFFGVFLLWFTFAIGTGVLMYFDDAMRAAVLGEEYDPEV